MIKLDWHDESLQSGTLRLDNFEGRIAEPATWRTFAWYRLKMDKNCRYPPRTYGEVAMAKILVGHNTRATVSKDTHALCRLDNKRDDFFFYYSV